ncbi:MAG TPA: SGNH/GDSL hydrolase family protein [Bacteroidia bacterium]|jgi:hypothetical protein|nr:SGNH/GDSL hydrolase family protein [Bacteroidia bacterium]
MKRTIIYTAAVVLALASCTKTQFSTPSYSTGSANFSTMVSVGNSLTQGFMDGGLYAYGQQNSYPNIIATQVRMAYPSLVFNQPNVTGNGSGYIHLVYENNQFSPIQPGDDSTAGTNPCDADASWATWGTNLQGNTYNNLGIAGITLDNTVALNSTELLVNNVAINYQVISLIGPTPLGNPYGRFINFGAVLGTPIQYIDKIRSSKATFFTCWLGNNDVLGYSLNGGVISSLTVTGFGTFPLDTITPPAIFAQKYDSILTAFHKLGAQGVCATIPDVATIPYFNTVPNYLTINGAPQYLWITTKTGVRQAMPGDLITLTAYSSILAGLGWYKSNPLPDNYVLDVDEVANVHNTTLSYNASIKSIAASFGYPVVDMYQFLTTLQKSYTIDGVTLTAQFIQGGAFGLDGVHPNAKGYAVIANQFINQINQTYGASIPTADVANYRGVLFPNY